MGNLPLEGIRVADLTMVTAGPNATLFMGDLGAEIIKIEAARYSDSFRRHGRTTFKGPRPYDHSAPFLITNRNKYGITLDLTHPLGKQVFKRLVQVSDVVTENFRAGVLARWGLDYDALKKVKPDIILISVGSQGSQGPESLYGSYGPVLDALSGMSSLAGYVGGTPTWTAGPNYPDQVASIFAAGLVLAALRHRQRTGEGGYIDLSQREFTTDLIGEAVLDYTVNGRVDKPLGNRHPSMAPHGCFPSEGSDQWVTVAVGTDGEWKVLCELMGQPALAQDPRFVTLAARKQNEDELEGIVGRWTSGRDKTEVARLLQSHGVAAGPVYNGKELLQDPHLKAREFVHYVDIPDMGPFPHKSTVPVMNGAKPGIRKRAPNLGEDNEHVYRTLLGLSDAEMDELRREHVIDTTPENKNLLQAQ